MTDYPSCWSGCYVNGLDLIIIALVIFAIFTFGYIIGQLSMRKVKP